MTSSRSSAPVLPRRGRPRPEPRGRSVRTWPARSGRWTARPAPTAPGTDAGSPDGTPAGVESVLRLRAVLVPALVVQLFFVWSGWNGDGSRRAIAGVQVVPVFLLVVIIGGGLAIARCKAVDDRLALAGGLTVALVVGLPVTRLIAAPKLLLFAFIGAPMLLTLVAIATRVRIRFPAGWPFVLLFGSLVLATLLAPDRSGTIRLLLTLGPAVPALLLSGMIGAQGWRLLGGTVIGLALFQTGLAVVEPFLFPRHLWGAAQLNSDGNAVPLLNGFLGGIDRSQGLLGHPLPLSLLLVVALAIAARHPALRVRWRVVVIAALIVGVVFSGSRNSMLMIVGLLLFFPLRWRLSFGRGVAAVVIAAVILLVTLLTGVLTSAALDDFASSGSYSHRLAAYDAFDQLLSHLSVLHALTGNGVSSLPRLFDLGLLQTDGFNVVDNQFITTLAQAGVIGLAGLVALCLRALRRAGWVLLPACCAVVATSLIFDWLSWPSSTVLCLIVLGLAVTPGRAVQGPAVRPVIAAG